MRHTAKEKALCLVCFLCCLVRFLQAAHELLVAAMAFLDILLQEKVLQVHCLLLQ